MEGCKRAVNLTGSIDCPSLQVLQRNLMPPASVRHDEAQLEEFVRNFCKTVYHPVGTCRMGTDTTTSVTDLRLRVHGIENSCRGLFCDA